MDDARGQKTSDLFLTMIAAEFPIPAHHGAKVDVWRRLQSFKRLGVKIQFVCWVSEHPNEKDFNTVKNLVEDLVLLPYYNGPFTFPLRMLLCLKYPLQFSSRLVFLNQKKILNQCVKKFGPHAIWLDGIHGAPCAFDLQQKSGKMLFYRSHNIEYLYHLRLLKAARGMGVIKSLLSFLHLEKWEKEILKRARLFFDISSDDLSFWQRLGYKCGRLFPPLLQSNVEQMSSDLKTLDAEFDFVFLGNLHTENNISGLRWLIDEVWPIIISKMPQATFLIAGSNPHSEIDSLCAKKQGITLLPNPPHSRPTYLRGRVMLNPVFTGSGVSLKSIEMLTIPRPIVTREQGLAGIPAEVHRYFCVARNVEEFSAHMLEQMQNPTEQNVPADLLDEHFGDLRSQQVLNEIRLLTQNL